MKQKTKKAAIKRFRITPRGKILRGHQMAAHLKAHKSKGAIGRYKKLTTVSKPEEKNIERLMPYAR